MKRNAKQIPIANRALPRYLQALPRHLQALPSDLLAFEVPAGLAGLPTYSPDYSPYWPVGNTGLNPIIQAAY